MEWLNTSVTFLNSPEFRRSKIEQRGVWLTLMGYCVQQENGGHIEGTASWSDWDWQQVLGVSEKAVHEDCTLWGWEDGAVLVLHGYPLEKEAEVRAKRRAGKRGGLARAAAHAKQIQEPTSSSASSSATSTPSSSASRTASTEGERKEKEKEKGNRKGKERKENRRGANAPLSAPTLPDWLAFVADNYPTWPELDARSAWAHFQASAAPDGSWLMGRGKRVNDWRPLVMTCFARWQGDEKNRDKKPAAFDADLPNAHTGGLAAADADSPPNSKVEVVT